MTTALTEKTQETQILNNPFISTPEEFTFEEGPQGMQIYRSFIDTRPASASRPRFYGSVVTNPLAVGAGANVVSCRGIAGSKPSQRLLIQTMSPQALPLKHSIDFIAPAAGAETDAAGGNLVISFTPGLHAPIVDVMKAGLQSFRLPLVVSPESAVIGTISPQSRAAMEELGIDFATMFNVARKVLPVVAKAGYQIYQELNQGKQDLVKNNPEGFLSGLLAVAQVAVPIAGSLLGALA